MPGEYSPDAVLKGYADKKNAGIDIPNYPQLRDMNEMFLELATGATKHRGSYIQTGKMEPKAPVPELLMLRDVRPLKACLTGPYTLSYRFQPRSESLIDDLAEFLCHLLKISHSPNLTVLTIDEPLFRAMDDPSLDYGRPEREQLIKAWERICAQAKALGLTTCLHIHSTTDELFWDVDHLDVLEFPVDDPSLQVKRTKSLLESRDKFLKISVAKTSFDDLILDRLGSTPEALSKGWRMVREGQDASTFLESQSLMETRLRKALDAFGERVRYFGPECGLKSFPSYELAIELLRRVGSLSR